MKVPQSDHDFMALALEQARQAANLQEVPVGALIVVGGQVLAADHNRREQTQNALDHAEIRVLTQACKQSLNWRLNEATLYVTLEPCLMCAGAILNARISRLVYGASDPKGGAVNSLYQVLQDPRLNHRVKSITSGVMESECSQILTEFFQTRRLQPPNK